MQTTPKDHRFCMAVYDSPNHVGALNYNRDPDTTNRRRLQTLQRVSDRPVLHNRLKPPGMRHYGDRTGVAGIYRKFGKVAQHESKGDARVFKASVKTTGVRKQVEAS